MSLLDVAGHTVETAETGVGAAAPAPVLLPEHRRSRGLIRRLQPGLILGIIVLAVVTLWAIVPGLFTIYEPFAGQPGQQLKAPSALHLLGTDSLGRDVYGRIVYGSINSLSGALAAVSIGLVVGTTMGIFAGSLSGWVDATIMRFVDVLLSIPALLLSLSVIALLGFGTTNAAIAVGVTSIASFARLVRSEVVTVRRSDYVEAAFGSGGTFLQVLWRHILPNSLTSVIGFTALQIGWAILQLATLGFLGFGAPPPTPEWGLLIAEGRNYIATAWWLTAAPGIVVVLVVLSVNRVSQAIGRARI
ncbi:ABC transporter permease [Rhizobium sp. VS19-DR104.2]|uniref:ABC transporter permease n=1 Tax=unclassified Rhizobium TaxID=2613769 RepID=UPI001CC3DFFB|nr:MULTISPECIES: ABC transporter permease [unclassified Rhizobium]MBZ5763644.1 ABC transporter permease [Rhizobium sp. VS19-DR96]MBZ5769487.1 ABC transporter permease [Rhizobium sp. VS19-DR129.2]MBZ5777065.1 ABC transporter permease [Rhizobium sp. VS19-DRK62.2]MBZ5788177.1 ABC transporter permease [Rhizobium sp. VS19-DR121]MBZ5805629.1 ABC transporter permease [Rhizobium sp. VS19-DR181]